MNTFQLECFLAVANSLSFARAAEQLNVSQPTITHQIKTLEDELNVRLFNRSTRMVEITPEGLAFIADAKSMVAIAAQAKMRYAIPDDRPITTISIGCSSYVQLKLLTHILNTMHAEISNFHPQLYVMPRDQLFHLLDADRMDVIFNIREGCEPNSNIKFKELVQSDIKCVCRTGSALSEKESVTIQDLRNESFIFCDPIHLSPDIASLQWKLAEGRSPADVHFCASSEASLVLAEAGIGVAILSELDYLNNSQTQRIPLQDAPKLCFGMFYKTFTGDSVLKKFIQVTQSYFTEKFSAASSE